VQSAACLARLLLIISWVHQHIVLLVSVSTLPAYTSVVLWSRLCCVDLTLMLQRGTSRGAQDLKQINTDLQRSQSEFFVLEEAAHGR
jgi:hypothetical protein